MYGLRYFDYDVSRSGSLHLFYLEFVELPVVYVDGFYQICKIMPILETLISSVGRISVQWNKSCSRVG